MRVRREFKDDEDLLRYMRRLAEFSVDEAVIGFDTWTKWHDHLAGLGLQERWVLCALWRRTPRAKTHSFPFPGLREFVRYDVIDGSLRTTRDALIESLEHLLKHAIGVRWDKLSGLERDVLATVIDLVNPDRGPDNQAVRQRMAARGRHANEGAVQRALANLRKHLGLLCGDRSTGFLLAQLPIGAPGELVQLARGKFARVRGKPVR